MQITIFFILGIFTFTFAGADVEVKKLDVRLPVHRPEGEDDKSPENLNVLLSTLFEMHHNLLAQISVLEDKLNTTTPSMNCSEIRHMVEHFTAEKKNIESSIYQIESNDGHGKAQSRNIAEDPIMETKSIPIILNLFKRTQTPAVDQPNGNIGYSLPYQQQLENQQAFFYQGSPQTNDLNNFQPQLYIAGDQTSFQQPEQLNAQILQQYAASSQGTNQQETQQQQIQQQLQPQFYASADQQNNYQMQANQEIAQKYTVIPQVVLSPQGQAALADSQFQAQQQIRPINLPVKSDIQRQHQPIPLGQKEGIFVYYPNGIITDDKERLTIADRVGQAFDRFGQAISSLGARQSTSQGTNNSLRSEIFATKESNNNMEEPTAIVENITKPSIEDKTKPEMEDKKP